MRFQDEFFEAYEMLKRQFSDKYDFSNAGDEGNQQNILRDIIEPIYYADVVIADLTGLNANVMYELGIAHTLNKKTIVITKDELSKLPFDLKQYRAKDYSTHFIRFAELITYLEENIDGAITGKVHYSNPVKDFMTLAGICGQADFCEASTELSEESEKGLLDFLNDIEEETRSYTETINQVAADMRVLTEGVDNSAAEINRVKKTGGNGTAAFVRKEVKKVAGHIRDFDSKLRDHSKSLESIWDAVEKNTLGLLENRFSLMDNNTESLKKYLIALSGIPDAIEESNNSLEELIATMNKATGLERSMNQAIKFCVDDLTTYMEITQRIVTSVNKILKKGKAVVGEIESESA